MFSFFQIHITTHLIYLELFFCQHSLGWHPFALLSVANSHVACLVPFIVTMHIHMKTTLSIHIRIMIYQCDGTTKALTNSIHRSILRLIAVCELHHFRRGMSVNFVSRIQVLMMCVKLKCFLRLLRYTLVFIMCLRK